MKFITTSVYSTRDRPWLTWSQSRQSSFEIFSKLFPLIFWITQRNHSAPSSCVTCLKTSNSNHQDFAQSPHFGFCPVRVTTSHNFEGIVVKWVWAMDGSEAVCSINDLWYFILCMIGNIKEADTGRIQESAGFAVVSEFRSLWKPRGFWIHSTLIKVALLWGQEAWFL